MNYYQHIAIGFIANSIAFLALVQAKVLSPYSAFNPVFSLTLLLSIALFSILPDVDSSNSVASKLLKAFLALLIVLYALEFISTRSTSSLVKIVLAVLVFTAHFLYAKRGRMHRQFPHTPAFGVLACVVLFMLTGSKTVVLAGGIAFASHLVADWKLKVF
jgi:hypothetical protein